MPLPRIDEIYLPLLNYISDGELHTLTACVLHLHKYFELSEKEKIQIYPSRKKLVKGSHTPVFATEFYVRIADVISDFRNAKPKAFLRDLPGTKSIGVFLIADDGLELLKLTKKERLEKIHKAKNLYNKIKKGSKSKK